jgi:hypothetical protein
VNPEIRLAIDHPSQSSYFDVGDGLGIGHELSA